MLIAALPREDGSGICRVIGLDAVRVGGTVRIGLLLVDGPVTAQDAPARFFPSDTTEEPLTVRLPELRDAPYQQFELEVIE